MTVSDNLIQVKDFKNLGKKGLNVSEEMAVKRIK